MRIIISLGYMVAVVGVILLQQDYQWHRHILFPPLATIEDPWTPVNPWNTPTRIRSDMKARCTTPLERSYLNEQWNYACPIDPLR